ncbi:MAG: hypothetical protein HDR00_03110 [Lachnospiraceae bacterium]|nr:hypothetical protein [Lachnospiraceae bacterium]
MRKRKGGLLCLILLCFCLTGCIPNEYTKEEAEEQEKAAVEIFGEYLDEELGSGEIEEVSVHTETLSHTVGYYLTDFVDGKFTYRGQTHSFVVNTRTEEIYTSLEVEETKEKGLKYLLDSLDISCDDIVESRFSIELYVPAMEEDTENLYEGAKTSLSGVLPAAYETSEQDIEKLFEDENYEIKLSITYKGKEGLNQEGYGIGELPGLKSLELKHMKDKAEPSEELGGIYDYMMSETLKETAQNESRTVRYARWEHLEQDGFHIFFEGYCREETDGEVKETVLEADEDIYLTVEKERIEIFCAEETNFFLFVENLSAKEAEMPAAWEFAVSNGNTRYAERSWLRDGKRFVLGGTGDRKPCVFQGREGYSAIYLGDAAKKVLKN